MTHFWLSRSMAIPVVVISGCIEGDVGIEKTGVVETRCFDLDPGLSQPFVGTLPATPNVLDVVTPRLGRFIRVEMADIFGVFRTEGQ